MYEELSCHDCGTPLSRERLAESGIVQCPACGARFTLSEQALTHVDEIPHEEYFGG